ncbi:hypothetical protein KO498_05170 [Lentibacter algarum]|uniref:hypothetical protein n=1 Tax=Lentibacter algarum TaxID=576131 RepID=UPI001C06D78C|nr:hypothetical protein [Lentibacter algarum]MBU2981197.1 hypothetical protein [Lentibacter algarum]
MSDTRCAHEGVSKILELELETARSAFAAINAAVAGVERQLTELTETAQTGAQSGGTAYTALGADLVWRRWVEGRRSILLQELAGLMAQREGAREALRHANGRANSFEAVAGVEKAKAPQKRARSEQRRVDLALIARSVSG